MSVPFSVPSKRVTSGVTVELTPSQIPPTLPYELRDYVTHNTWEIRMSTLTRFASQYCRPSLERAYLVLILTLSLLVPIVTYYAAFHALQNTIDVDRRVWLARFICFAFVIATWIALSVPILVWKYLGRVRVTRLTDQWTRTDALSAPSYGAAPIWKASMPRLFRDTIVLTVIAPLSSKSHFDHNSFLPPYVSTGDDALPSYGADSKMVQWSKDPKGGVKYGALPIYTDDRSVVV